MSKPDEYRANAQECQRMAGISRNPNEKAVWQQMAQHWLRMIPKAESPKSDQFEAAQSRADQGRKVAGAGEGNRISSLGRCKRRLRTTMTIRQYRTDAASVVPADIQSMALMRCADFVLKKFANAPTSRFPSQACSFCRRA